MTDHRILPAAHPFEFISIDPITSWPVEMPDGT